MKISRWMIYPVIFSTIAVVLSACNTPENKHRDAYLCYDAIQKALVAQSVSSETVKCSGDVFPEQQDFIKSLTQLSADTSQPNPFYLGLDQKYAQAYLEFIHLPAKADVLYDYLTSQQKLYFSQLNGSGSVSGALSWGWANLAQAAVEAYRTTGDLRFFDFLLDGSRVALDNTDGRRGIEDAFGHKSIIGWSILIDGKLGREITTAGRILSPILEMALLAKKEFKPNDHRLGEISKLADTASHILKGYLPLQIIDGKQHYFRSPWTGNDEAINHMAAFAQACAFASALTGDKAFSDFVSGFESYFFSHVRTVSIGDLGNAYSWPYGTGYSFDEMFWKGAVTVPALIRMHKLGFEITSEQRSALVGSFSGLVLKQGSVINAYISDKVLLVNGYSSYFQGSSVGVGFTSYVLLDEWAPGIKTSILNAVAFRRDVFPRGMLLHSMDAVGYAYLLPRRAVIEQPPGS